MEKMMEQCGFSSFFICLFLSHFNSFLAFLWGVTTRVRLDMKGLGDEWDLAA